MNTDNQPTPDDSYRKAWQQVFDEAAESPPPRVWDAVERQLDGDGQSRVVPLWATVRPWVTGIAAAVAFVLAGWWAWQSPTPETKTAQSTIDQSSATATLDEPNKGAEAGTKLAKAKQKKLATYAGIAPKSRRLTDRTRAHQPHEETALVDPPNQDVLSPANPLVTPEIKLGAGVGDSLLAGVSHGKQPTTGIDAPDRENPGRLDAMEPLAGASQAGNPTALMPKMELIANEQKIAPASPKSTEEARSLPSVERLVGKAFRNHPLAIQRVVWFRNDEPLVTETKQVKPVGREKWASISAMPLSFNPVLGVQLQPQFQSFNFTNSDTYSFAANRVAAKTPSLRSESGGAVLVQISAGTQLTDRWSVEAGVGYLQAQSTVEGPARLNASIDMSVDADQTLYTAVVWDAINRNKVSTTAPGLVNANKAY
ncbi:MAG: anti-sigma factor, partial [Bacteroidetes bacterium]|nr:anti-sigma factor [Fibrella sp.]